MNCPGWYVGEVIPDGQPTVNRRAVLQVEALVGAVPRVRQERAAADSGEGGSVPLYRPQGLVAVEDRPQDLHRPREGIGAELDPLVEARPHGRVGLRAPGVGRGEGLVRDLATARGPTRSPNEEPLAP